MEVLLDPRFAVPAAIAVAVPLVFLVVVRRLDLYASGSLPAVLACMAFGALAIPLSLATNTVALRLLTPSLGATAALALVKTTVAPVVEEVFKSVGIVDVERRPAFTYFVDGAVYGFAAGTAFAVVENLFYLSSAGAPLALSINRVFSTCLMHAASSSLVGVSIGRFRFARGPARWLALPLGWSGAIAVHAGFNGFINAAPLTPARLFAAIGFGLAGAAMTAAFIAVGLREERAWLAETLHLGTGVSAHEANVVQRLGDAGDLLAPIARHFGAERRRQVGDLLVRQAQLGLKRKAAAMSPDERLSAALAAEADALEAEIDRRRREIGIYCMAYVRAILPPDGSPLWDGLRRAVDAAPEARSNLFQTLSDRTRAAPPAPPAPDQPASTAR